MRKLDGREWLFNGVEGTRVVYVCVFCLVVLFVLVVCWFVGIRGNLVCLWKVDKGSGEGRIDDGEREVLEDKDLRN